MHPHHAMGVRHDAVGASPDHESSGTFMGGPHDVDKHPLGKHGALHGDGMKGYHGAASSYGSGDEGGAADMHDNEHHEIGGEEASAQHGMAFPGAAAPFKKGHGAK